MRKDQKLGTLLCKGSLALYVKSRRSRFRRVKDVKEGFRDGVWEQSNRRTKAAGGGLTAGEGVRRTTEKGIGVF
jgi:hypothetical protein